MLLGILPLRRYCPLAHLGVVRTLPAQVVQRSLAGVEVDSVACVAILAS